MPQSFVSAAESRFLAQPNITEVTVSASPIVENDEFVAACVRAQVDSFSASGKRIVSATDYLDIPADQPSRQERDTKDFALISPIDSATIKSGGAVSTYVAGSLPQASHGTEAPFVFASDTLASPALVSTAGSIKQSSHHATASEIAQACSISDDRPHTVPLGSAGAAHFMYSEILAEERNERNDEFAFAKSEPLELDAKAAELASLRKIEADPVSEEATTQIGGSVIADTPTLIGGPATAETWLQREESIVSLHQNEAAAPSAQQSTRTSTALSDLDDTNEVQSYEAEGVTIPLIHSLSGQSYALPSRSNQTTEYDASASSGDAALALSIPRSLRQHASNVPLGLEEQIQHYSPVISKQSSSALSHSFPVHSLHYENTFTIPQENQPASSVDAEQTAKFPPLDASISAQTVPPLPTVVTPVKVQRSSDPERQVDRKVEPVHAVTLSPLQIMKMRYRNEAVRRSLTLMSDGVQACNPLVL